jgi:hypothetical protein
MFGIRRCLAMWVFRGGILLAILAFGTCVWAKEPRTFSQVTLGETGTLHPGGIVRINWAPLPRDTEEFELLLQCESPVDITFRLTESQDPSLVEYSWKVPAIPCDSARIILRRGTEARECLWGRSAAFRIGADRIVAVARVDFLNGEYWVSKEPAPETWGGREEELWQTPHRRGEPVVPGRAYSGTAFEVFTHPTHRTAPPKARQDSQLVILRSPHHLTVQLRI